MRKNTASLVLIIFVMFFVGCTAQPTETQSVATESETTSAPKATPKPTATPAPTATPEPTPTPTPTPTPAPKIPETAVYTGSGDDVLELQPFEGLYVFYIAGNQDSSHFAVNGYDSMGNDTELFVNTTDPYSGITIDPSQSTAMLEISATGSWTIEVRSIYTSRVISMGETIEGVGDEILLVLESGKTATINGNEVSSHFAVKSYGKTDDELLVNTTDPYSGNVMLKGEPVIMGISADGPWSIAFN